MGAASYGSVVAEVKAKVGEMTGDFTVAQIVAGTDLCKTSVAALLCRMAKAGTVVCVRCGSGRRPGVFRNAEKTRITPVGIGIGHDETGGAVGSLTEAVIGVTAGLCRIADAIESLASAVRERHG